MPDSIVEIVFPYQAPFDLRFTGEPFRTQAESFAISGVGARKQVFVAALAIVTAEGA